MNDMIIILVGVPGAGKSTILKAVTNACTVNIVNYGEVMLQQAAKQGLERDCLRRLPVKQQQEMGLAAAQCIVEQSDSLTIKTPVGYCPGIPLEILNILNPKALVFIQTSPQRIMERRLRDGSRQRDEENLTELTLHQELTKNYLITASALTGAALCMINNDEEKLSQNIDPLVNLIHSISKKPF
jgi:adenylate kinase